MMEMLQQNICVTSEHEFSICLVIAACVKELLPPICSLMCLLQASQWHPEVCFS